MKDFGYSTNFMAKKHWIAKAVPKSHKGRFGAKAARAGMSTHAYAEKEKHASGTLGREARLAINFEEMRAHHPHRVGG
jgi:hypothetical protein